MCDDDEGSNRGGGQRGEEVENKGGVGLQNGRSNLWYVVSEVWKNCVCGEDKESGDGPFLWASGRSEGGGGGEADTPFQEGGTQYGGYKGGGAGEGAREG